MTASGPMEIAFPFVVYGPETSLHPVVPESRPSDEKTTVAFEPASADRAVAVVREPGEAPRGPHEGRVLGCGDPVEGHEWFSGLVEEGQGAAGDLCTRL